MRFIKYADTNRILLAVLPPHSTHHLQPLDVGLFSSLITYYSQQIDKLLAESQRLVRLTKRDFWPLFRES
jgi:DDE superfamily endonuclease